MTFQLHSQLQKDCISLGNFSLCKLLLMNNKRYPWFILVPEIAGISEIYQLTEAQQHQLVTESSYLSEQLMLMFRADKLNIAAIGNMVPQLHVHHVVRYRNDDAWPAPVWGKLPVLPYSELELVETVKFISEHLKLLNT